MRAAGLRLRAWEDLALGAGLPLLGAGLGATAGLAAFAVHPLAIPGALLLGGVLAASVVRVEIGVAAAFVFLPLGYVVDLDVPAWLPGAVWIGLLFALAVAGWLAGEAAVHVPTGLGAALLAVLVAAGVGAIVTQEFSDALPVLRTLVTGLALAFVIATGIRTLDQVRWVLAGLSGAALVIGAYAAWEYLGGGQTDSGFFTSSGELARRVSAGFGQANQLGGILVLLLPFSIAGVMLHRRASLLHLAAIALASYGVYVSFSRGALVSLVVIPLVFARGRAALLVVPLLAAAVAVATPDLVQERFATLTEQGSDFATRLDFYNVAVAVWADAPLTGGGLGSFPDAYAKARVPGKDFLPATIFEPPPHAHNLGLHTLAEQGLLGFVALLAALGAIARTAFAVRHAPVAWVRPVGSAALASVAALVVHNLVDVTLLETTAILFWSSLGLLAVASHCAVPGRD